MGIESDTERDIFLDTVGFGETVTFTANGGSPTSVNVIFDDELVDINPATGEAGDVSPSCQGKVSDLASGKE